MSNDNTYRIRPAGRHILTIGSDLIKDRYAAVVELVKNAYDADAGLVTIRFSSMGKNGEEKPIPYIKIEITDNGHGMSFDDVEHRWLVPSTDNKLKRINSPGGRKLQGRKGIGRYAASILGDDFIMETVDKNHEKTALHLRWSDFKTAGYLEDVPIALSKSHSDENSGTRLIISGDDEYLNLWTENEIGKLIKELKKLLAPKVENDPGESFKIKLEFKDFPVSGYRDYSEFIEPFPLQALYDYRISGTVTEDGKASLIYHNNTVPHSLPENISLDIPINRQEAAFCGKLDLDFRVYDRDKGSSLEKKEALAILDEHHGIGVYRHGFRIRPLGDPGYDWLELDKQRVQQPAMRIGSNQVIGSVHIQSEEESGLEEKSARDGLKENLHFEGLKIICKQVLQKLQERRFIYREKAHLGRRKKPLEKRIQDIFVEGDTRTEQKLDEKFDDLGIPAEKREVFYKLIGQQNAQKLKIVEEIEEKLVIYQGQATLGKIVNVILHEGRSPLSIIRNETSILHDYGRMILEKFSQDLVAKIAKSCEKTDEQALRFVELFRKIDPLAAKKRSSRKEFDVLKVIKDIFAAFESELKGGNISYRIDWATDIRFNGWKEDFMAVFTNLIDNSIYWLNTSSKESKEIKVTGYLEDNRFIIDFIDNGPGIEEYLIENDIIFEPGFTRKPDGGYGLGLAIAGEAIGRNDGQLEAIYSESGAFFRITLKGENLHVA